jgi:AraC-like DNA-binding protein
VPSFSAPVSIKTILEGEATWITGKERRIVRPDSLLIVPEDQEYGIEIDRPVPTETFCVFFQTGAIAGAMQELISPIGSLLDTELKERSFNFATQLHSSHGNLGKLMRGFAGQFKTSPAANLSDDWALRLTLAAASHLVGRLACAGNLAALRSTTRREIIRRLERARDRMEQSLETAWSLRRLADVAAMSPFHFHRCFTQAHRETPLDYLQRRRLERALSLLQLGGASVTEVCDFVGYRSLGSFSAAFRKRFGLSPSAVKRTGKPARVTFPSL